MVEHIIVSVDISLNFKLIYLYHLSWSRIEQMKIEKHYLGKEKEDGFTPSITLYLLDKVQEAPLRPFILIFPGGGYFIKAENWEGERIAIEYNRAGFNAGVVDYPVYPSHHPSPLLSAMDAISFVRENALSWQSDKDKVVVLGFSAGGHLAASLCNLWKEYGKGNRIYRPDGAILCYPVITTGEGTHKPSIINLVGDDDENGEVWRELSMEKRVNSDTPPTFLWHTYEDSTVSVDNSLLYASALSKNKVPFELHVYPKGEHGLSLATEELCRTRSIFPRNYEWVKLSVDWIIQLFGL